MTRRASEERLATRRNSVSGYPVDGTAPDHQGYVTKCGGSVRSWKKRWMVLRDNTLIYFAKPGAKAKGQLEISKDDSVHAVKNSDKSEFMFAVNTAQRTFLMYTESGPEREAWLQKIQGAIDRLNGKDTSPMMSVQRTSSGSSLAPRRSSVASAGTLSRSSNSPRKRLESVSNVHNLGELTMSSNELRFDVRDILLWSKDVFQHVFTSGDFADSKEDLWNLWLAHVPATFDDEDGESDDERDNFNTLRPAANKDSAITEVLGTVSYSLRCEGSSAPAFVTYMAVSEHDLILQRIIDYLYCVSAPNAEFEMLKIIANLARPTHFGLWTKIFADNVVSGGYIVPLAKIDGKTTGGSEIVQVLGHAKLLEWFGANSSRVTVTHIARNCGSVMRGFVVYFECEARQVEMLVSTFSVGGKNFPPLPLSCVQAIRPLPKDQRDVFLRAQFSDAEPSHVGYIEVVVPADARTVQTEPVSRLSKLSKGLPSHVCYRLSPATTNTVFEWNAVDALRETITGFA